jgi:hypothetical protein
MALTDTRSTVLEIINETRRKQGINNSVSSLSQDSKTIVMVDYLNDVLTEINDFGLWNETIGTTTIPLVVGQRDYNFSAALNVKTIKDVFLTSTSASLPFIDQQQMRLLFRQANTGQPRQWTIFGADANANPIIRVYPTPDASAAGITLDVFYQSNAPRITTATPTSTVIGFPARMVVQGLHARCILDEEGGAPTNQYQQERLNFENLLKETFNRYKGDVGYYRRFIPTARWRA